MDYDNLGKEIAAACGRSDPLETFVTNEPDEAEAFIRDFVHEDGESKVDILGFDAEFVVVKGRPRQLCVLQLATQMHVLVAHVKEWTELPELFQHVLTSPDVLKVGSNIFAAEVNVVKDKFGIDIGDGCIDTRNALMRSCVPPLTGCGLKQLAQVVLGLKDWSEAENMKIARTNWRKYPLDQDQLVYAAIDAVVSRDLFLALYARRLSEEQLSLAATVPESGREWKLFREKFEHLWDNWEIQLPVSMEDVLQIEPAVNDDNVRRWMHQLIGMRYRARGHPLKQSALQRQARQAKLIEQENEPAVVNLQQAQEEPETAQFELESSAPADVADATSGD
ncbi:MAG: hypothetical protein MHM6MM_002345 [Cercozoa sp. M6MM]